MNIGDFAKDVASITGTSEADAKVADELASLRGQLGTAHARTSRLQAELQACEAELSETNQGYALVWEELQAQRTAMAPAIAQCQALQEQVDRAGIGGTVRSGTDVTLTPDSPHKATPALGH